MSDETKAILMGFAEARIEIQAGRARSHALWGIFSDEHQRDGFALRPEKWEGSGEYQRVVHEDGRDVYVRIPFGESLPKNRASA